MWQGDELGGNIFPLGDDNFDDNGEQDSNYGNEDDDSHRNKYYDDDDDDIYYDAVCVCLSVTKNHHFLLGVSCNHLNPP